MKRTKEGVDKEQVLILEKQIKSFVCSWKC